VAFSEAGLRQLKQNGICAFICADRWMLNQYGAELRRLVTSSFSIEAVVEMHEADAFELEVSSYPAITIIRRAKQGPAVVANANSKVLPKDIRDLACKLTNIRLQPYAELQTIDGVTAARVEDWFSGTAPWPCVSPERLALLKRLEAEFAPLESVETKTIVGIGVATGCDEIYITKNNSIVEPSRLLPLAMACDAKDGRFTWSGHYLVDPWGEKGLLSLSDYPRLAAYFEKHRQRLKNRNVGKRNPDRWHRTIDRVNHGLLCKDKLYIPDIKNRIYPVLDKGQTYPHHNLYFVQSDIWDMEVLGGLLLSRVAQFFVECYGGRMRGGYLRFQAQYLRRICVPNPSSISEEQAGDLRDAFRCYNMDKATSVALKLYGLDGYEANTLISHPAEDLTFQRFAAGLQGAALTFLQSK
jgi:hypothetical protein